MVSFRNGGGGPTVLEPVLSIEFYSNTFPLLINILIRPPVKKSKQVICLISALFIVKLLKHRVFG